MDKEVSGVGVKEGIDLQKWSEVFNNFIGISFDQQVKADAGKLRLTLVPREIIRAIARARMYGLIKYGDKESWRSVSEERYRDALFRHLLLYLDDPDGVDEESGLSHLDHIATNVAFLCELKKENHDG